ncbi:MAG: isochorismatase family protein [Bacillota bacterium]
MIPRAKQSSLSVVLIDAQPAFWEAMCGDPEPVLSRLEQLLIACEWFDLPLLATFEEPTEVKGWLPQRLERVFPHQGHRMVKRTFDLIQEPTIARGLAQMGRPQLALAGAETDVCVLQSALGLLEAGYTVFLLEDCVFTSEPDPRTALRRAYQAGAVPCTYKTLHYELLATVDPLAWQEKHREAVSRGFRDPESLPPI